MSSEPPSPHVRRHGGEGGMEEAWSRDTSPPTARQGGRGGPGAAAAAVWADSILHARLITPPERSARIK